MNKFIKDQLSKVRYASVPEFNDSTTELLIPKGEVKPEAEFVVNNYYLVEFEDYILYPFEGFTLHENWNNGKAPVDKRMNIEVLQIMGKMIKIHGVGETTHNMWEGWIPKKSMKILKTL